MITKKMLITGTMSTLMLATNLYGQCTGDSCMANLKNLKKMKVVKELVNSESFVHNETGDSIDHSFEIILDGEKVLVFASYEMSEEEKLAYAKEQKAIRLNKIENEKANEDLRIVQQEIKPVSEKIIEKTTLPTSEYFCEKDTHPVYDKNSKLFECVSFKS